MPFQLEVATTANFGLVGDPPDGGFDGSPGPPAGISAGGFRWTVPSGAVARMSSFALVELKVIECGPIRYQVTEPPTGILIVFGPNSSIEIGAVDAGDPDPARTMVPGGVAIGAGACP